jgi:hypothetical protein
MKNENLNESRDKVEEKEKENNNTFWDLDFFINNIRN